jgi:phage terminase Nu1 subunit (DNA packaging protein)
MGSSSSAAKWVCKTQREAGLVLGVSARTIQDYVARGCPGKKDHYPLIEMIAWCKQNIWNRHSMDLGASDAEEETPPLERLRTERARLAQLDRLEREGEILSREDVHSGLGIIASKLHWGLEQIEREHPQAAKILRETLDGMEREFRERFGYGDSG